jgi:two-component system OmpR family sensor kinase
LRWRTTASASRPASARRSSAAFYQVDRRLARESGGVGLGLSIVELNVRARGGSIDVKSQPGRGSISSGAIPEAA